jgi:hypothetical protein
MPESINKKMKIKEWNGVDNYDVLRPETEVAQIADLGSGVGNFLKIPSSANLAAAITGQTGSGALVFGTSPSISNATISASDLGTPTAINLTNATNLALGGSSVTGTLPVGKGGTGATTLTGILKGNGVGAISAATATDITALIGTNAVTKATNIASSTLWTVPYQSEVDTTSFVSTVGASTGYVLQYNSGSAPTWVSTSSLPAVDTATYSFNLKGGSSGQLPYQTATDTTGFIPVNATATNRFLRNVSSGTPSWETLVNSDIPSALTGKTYNALTLTALTTGFSIAGGTTSKTLTVSDTANVSGTNTGDQTITLTGDVTGTGTGSFSTTLATIAGLSAGTYNNSAISVRPFTIDIKGRITAIGTAVTITPAWSSITGTPTTVSGYGITDAATITAGANSNITSLTAVTSIGSTGALTINSASGTALTLDSIGTGNVNLATGNANKVISIGNTASTSNLNINNNTVLAQGKGLTLSGATSGTVQIIATGTAGNNVLTLPATTGTVVTTGDTSTVTNLMLAGSISDNKLSQITTANKVANSATTATSVNTASAIVARDSSGNFSAGTITATSFSGNLSGNATTATTATNVNGGTASVTNLTASGVITLPNNSIKSAMIDTLDATNLTGTVSTARLPMDFGTYSGSGGSGTNTVVVPISGVGSTPTVVVTAGTSTMTDLRVTSTSSTGFTVAFSLASSGSYLVRYIAIGQ